MGRLRLVPKLGFRIKISVCFSVNYSCSYISNCWINIWLVICLVTGRISFAYNYYIVSAQNKLD